MSVRDESIRSNKSIRSCKSQKSLNNLRSPSSTSHKCDPQRPSFEEVLPFMCVKYECPYQVYVKKEYQTDEFYHQMKYSDTQVKYKKITVAVPTNVSQIDVSKIEHKTMNMSPSEVSLDEGTIVITSLYDHAHNLTELKLHKIPIDVPRSLLTMINILAASYDCLTKITINDCLINSEIIYELSKSLRTDYITDICLDGSHAWEGNFYILLDHKDSQIKHLSLCRCKINDEVCKEIAIRLHFLCPAQKILQLLNLSSNHITDEGAKHLGEALRSNRHLRYLNLADNRIGDEGACAILDSLIEFRLTHDENMCRKRRLFAYLTEKNILIEKYLNECHAESLEELSQFSRKSVKKKKVSATTLKNKGPIKSDSKKDGQVPSDYYKAKAELFANELLGSLREPFDSHNIVRNESDWHCIGNMFLCYLNLSYNQMGYLSVKKLLAVLQYQRLTRKVGQSGLIKIVIEGNPMPKTCIEYQNITEHIRSGKTMQQFGGRLSIAGQKKRSARISITPSLASGRLQ